MIIGRWTVAIVTLAFLCVLAASIATWVNDSNVKNARRDMCLVVEDVRLYVRDASDRALESLPTVDYYREHPDELSTALDNLRDQRDAFSPPLDCNAYALGHSPTKGD